MGSRDLTSRNKASLLFGLVQQKSPVKWLHISLVSFKDAIRSAKKRLLRNTELRLYCCWLWWFFT